MKKTTALFLFLFSAKMFLFGTDESKITFLGLTRNKPEIEPT